ncbi:MAG: zf-HC2 domain-containing protein [Armatimonadetes bacterium]|nr:zf-HC2 domain-containing protein [Armatimonadota bacterium]
MKCVSEKELERFLQADMKPEMLVALDEHIATCATCRVALETLPVRAQAIAEFGAEIIGANDCPDYERLSAFIEETLESAELKSVEAHVKLCEPCARDVERMISLRSQAALREKVRVRPGGTRQTNVWAIGLWWRKVVAGLAAAGVIAAAVVILREPPKEHIAKPVAVTTTPSFPTPKPEQKPDVTPPRPSQATLVANKPNETRPVNSRTIPLLKDGKYQIVKSHGKVDLVRIDGKSIRTPLEAQVAALISEKIATGRIKPSEPVRVAMNTIHIRSEEYSPPPTAPKQMFPVGIVVMSNRPLFRWTTVDLADSYRIIVTDKDGNEVFVGTTDKTGLKLTTPLEHGRVYFWRVGVRFNKNDTWANSPAAGFRIVSKDDIEKIEAVRKHMPGSRLALATIYESVGLYGEAEEQYRAVLRANPASALARRLMINP